MTNITSFGARLGKCVSHGLWTPFVLSLAWLAAAPGATALAASECEVNVVVDMSETGRKIMPPSREHPVFYVPIVMGYSENGAHMAGEKPPPTGEVLHQLAKVLAAQGYLAYTEKTPPPSLVLIFHWGYLNPEIISMEQPQEQTPAQEAANFAAGQSAPTETVQYSFNRQQMLALVAGNTLRNFQAMPSWFYSPDRQSLLDAIQEDRYFVLVTAFDWEAAKQHKKVLLWSAKMSVRSAGITMDNAVFALIKSGGPFFGHETLMPQLVRAPKMREGQVKLGEPVVKGYFEPGSAEKTPPEKKR